MKIARFSTGDEPRYGIVQGLPEHETASGESEGHLLVLKGDPLYSLPEATGEVVELREARLLSPVIPRSKVVGIGKNYGGHIAEMGEDEPPRDPVVFLKPNTSVIGPDAPIVLPAWSEEVHYEAELAVVIKTLAKDVPRGARRRRHPGVHGRQRRLGPRPPARRAAVGAGQGLRHLLPPWGRGSRFPSPAVNPSSRPTTQSCAPGSTDACPGGPHRRHDPLSA